VTAPAGAASHAPPHDLREERGMQKRYHIEFTTSTIAADLDEAIQIAVDQVRDGSAYMEIEEEEIDDHVEET
jgi:hypothetical protein